MVKVQDTNGINECSDDVFTRLRDWFFEFDQSRWDKKLTNDSNAGKLDFLIISHSPKIDCITRVGTRIR